MNNPLEIFYCWQAVVTALMVYMLTQALKSYLPYVYTPKTVKGKTLYKRFILVSIPPILGFIGSALIPMHPEVLIAYVAEHANNTFDKIMIYGGWGAAVGQFADYLYSKIKSFISDYKPNNNNNSSSDENSTSA